MARLDRRDLLSKWRTRQDAYIRLKELYSQDIGLDDETSEIPGRDDPDAHKAGLYKQLAEVCSEFVKDLSLL